jgi:cytochrome c peroxidase
MKKNYSLLLVLLQLFITQSLTLRNVGAQEQYKGIFSPLPTVPELSTLPSFEQARAKLGKKLYNDANLSISRKISCNSCHGLSTYGVDHEPTSPGHLGKRGERNSPTVYNSALHFKQFWDGRAENVEAQALGPVLNPGEMAMPEESVVISRLSESEEYKKLFTEAFPQDAQPISFQNMGSAIGFFERRMLSPSRFDKYLQGDSAALNDKEKAGLQLFVSSGCIACHSGVAVGGQMFQKIGLVKPYETKDLGLFNLTKKESDKYFFKVPSLRNVSETAPYFHDGKVETLAEAIQLMGRHQLGKELNPAEVESISDFLRSLKGEIPKEAL